MLLARMLEKRRFIQVIMGPGQVGKSTLMKQVVNALDIPFVFYPADAVPATQLSWISDCWNAARAKMRVEGLKELILVIDEIQKITGWSEVVKKEWDSDTFYDVNLKVILLGSSRVMLDKGLSDSLQGRFERIILSHWSFADAVQDRSLWGRLFESAIGAHIMSYAYAGDYKVYYWRTNPGTEVDYVLEKKGKVIAIEVKSNSDSGNKGLDEFKAQYKPYLALVVGDGGMKAEDFLSSNPVDLFK